MKETDKPFTPLPSGNLIPRPMNSFILYRRDQSLQTPKTDRTVDLSKQIGSRWHSESKEVKEYYRRLAEEEKANHKKLYPDYVFVRNARDKPLLRQETLRKKKKLKKRAVRTKISQKVTTIAPKISNLPLEPMRLRKRIKVERETTPLLELDDLLKLAYTNPERSKCQKVFYYESSPEPKPGPRLRTQEPKPPNTLKLQFTTALTLLDFVELPDTTLDSNTKLEVDDIKDEIVDRLDCDDEEVVDIKDETLERVFEKDCDVEDHKTAVEYCEVLGLYPLDPTMDIEVEKEVESLQLSMVDEFGSSTGSNDNFSSDDILNIGSIDSNYENFFDIPIYELILGSFGFSDSQMEITSHFMDIAPVEKHFSPMDLRWMELTHFDLK